jgi:hypothetical protein
MANLAEYMLPRGITRVPARPYSDGFTTPRSEDKKIRGLRLVLVWLTAILGSWGLVGLLVYGGYKMASALLS